MAQECGIEERDDGTRICKLHKIPLVQRTMTPVESNPYGHPDPMMAAWYCPTSGQTVVETNL